MLRYSRAHLSRISVRRLTAAEDQVRPAQGSYGLGLAIAKKIAEEHKGTLRAESRGGETTFTCTLPLKK